MKASNKTGGERMLNQVLPRILTIHISLAIIETLITVNNDLQKIISSIISVTLIMLWYISIRAVRKNGFLNSIIVSLFFTVPSILFGMAYGMNNSVRVSSSDIWTLIGMMFSRPFALENVLFSSEVSTYTQIAIPIIVMNVLLLINFIEYTIEKRKTEEKSGLMQ